MAHTELDDRVVAFLTEGTRTGKVAFVSASGRALVAPIWFIVDDGVLVFNTGADTAKGRALSRDRRLTILVDDERPPFSFVQVQGTAEIGEDPADLLDTATRIAARYMGPDLADAYGRRNAVPGELVVRLTPTKVNAVFDIAD
ncbi:putative pyridoxamine 5'-phosphate oxidase [Gordonia polyisoprenivorans VH2]|uniref:PPOX class F420-dependent oxidoreductase n=2 Tax=Gordonia polyisoprenivorans TaxID=84595 RepID=A0A846WU22_9ACTN|nr:PPOX class F420-dependent oxidoreductase [Gordonia polyisoprenivorans]AFA76007.1 putative pyridoxamine 5'-phosphate oxidase [Gordonia polyisoprenivorans VH2]NKY04250.1 PPOX class F420-dependent oxidoreductase [Gordonia polyisoprenivorans]UZF56426.1 PPOX class F420-dependent oxidoreductase [Gordonia polyisoprenivorans]GAB21992.1 putative oxidoreductase [Gordonia polyisoprenivorans NBRC 16320 = JCM 10675]